MRGRRRRPLAIPAADTPILEAVARSRSPAPADSFHRTGSSNRHPAALGRATSTPSVPWIRRDQRP